MTQDEIIRMAREAGFKTENWTNCAHISVCANGVEIGIGDKLERFAALVAAHEREKQADISALPIIIEVAVKEAVIAEREACAKVCDEKLRFGSTGVLEADKATTYTALDCAAAIRARTT